MKGFFKAICLIFFLSFSIFAIAKSTVLIVTPTDYVWKDGPASMPKGAQYMLLEGDPEKAEPYILRMKFPPHYQLTPHTHPHPERVTVISGTFHVGLGTKMDLNKGVTLPAGTFGLIPPGVAHYAWTGDEGAIGQFQGRGPRHSDYF